MTFACETCRFFAAYELGYQSDDAGECRCFAPTARLGSLGNSGRRASWPVVALGDWCGEYQQKEKP